MAKTVDLTPAQPCYTKAFYLQSIKDLCSKGAWAQGDLGVFSCLI